jgi:Fe-S-cluster containining protein
MPASRRQITAEDCRTCGACCVGGFDEGYGWADCTVDDVKRMSRAVRAQLVTQWPTTEDIKQATPAVQTDGWGTACAFLRGTPGKRVSCRIYATRPTACSGFKPGSRGCIDARRKLELPT